MNDDRCYKCGAESERQVEFKYNGEIIETRHVCDECFMNLIIGFTKVATDFEIEEDV